LYPKNITIENQVNPLVQAKDLEQIDLMVKRALENALQQTDDEGRFIISSESEFESIKTYLQCLYCPSDDLVPLSQR